MNARRPGPGGGQARNANARSALKADADIALPDWSQHGRTAPLRNPRAIKCLMQVAVVGASLVFSTANADAGTAASPSGAIVASAPASAPRAASTIAGANAAPSAAVTANDNAASIAAGQRVFARCASCHQIGGTAGAAFGPQLTGIVGRRAAATTDFAYSPAMKASRLVWTEKNLAAFVRDPKSVVPGTSMRFWGLGDARQIADLLAYLKSVK